MAKETRVQVKVLTSFSSAKVDGNMRGYRPGSTVSLPQHVAAEWAEVGFVEMLGEDAEAQPEPQRRSRAVTVPAGEGGKTE